MLTPSNQYLQAVEEINDYVNQAKCRASVSVNSEIMKTNIFIGNVIIRNSEWGNKFVENLSKDMKMRFPSAKGYSVRNLKYMKKFAQIFTEDDVDEYGLGRITWSHHQILMSKVSNREEYIWYLEKTLEHKWSVDDLTSQVKKGSGKHVIWIALLVLFAAPVRAPLLVALAAVLYDFTPKPTGTVEFE